MSELDNKQLEEINNLIHEAAHLLTLNDTIDLELFKMNSGFEWELSDRESCLPENIVKSFIQLLEEAKTRRCDRLPHEFNDMEYSETDILGQLKNRISPLYEIRRGTNYDAPNQINSETHLNHRQ